MTEVKVRFKSTTNPRFQHLSGQIGVLQYTGPGTSARFLSTQHIDGVYTSTVKEITLDKKTITIETLNSTYVFTAYKDMTKELKEDTK